MPLIGPDPCAPLFISWSFATVLRLNVWIRYFFSFFLFFFINLFRFGFYRIVLTTSIYSKPINSFFGPIEYPTFPSYSDTSRQVPITVLAVEV